MKLLIPIAGRGSRFKKEAHLNPEYHIPKPFISVRGYPMVRWATGSLPFVAHRGQRVGSDFAIRAGDIVFVALEEHERDYALVRRLKEIYGKEVNVLLIPEVTRGAAETALCAEEYIVADEPLLVSDSDHFFDGGALLNAIAADPSADGFIPVFEVPEGDTKWSFSRFDPSGSIDLVAEKQPISTWANIGAYYFGRGSDFLEAATEAIERGEYVNNEFYLAPLYNKLIARGRSIKAVFPKYVYGLGTPRDLEYFLQETNFDLSDE
ncbi:MAG: hypothetical protein Q8R39_03425 [bacterium]|nr:hypothetical protein [bacterium]